MHGNLQQTVRADVALEGETRLGRDQLQAMGGGEGQERRTAYENPRRLPDGGRAQPEGHRRASLQPRQLHGDLVLMGALLGLGRGCEPKREESREEGVFHGGREESVFHGGPRRGVALLVMRLNFIKRRDLSTP